MKRFHLMFKQIYHWIWWHTRSKKWWATGQYQATEKYTASHVLSMCPRCKIHGNHKGRCISACGCTGELRDPDSFPENCWIFQCTWCGCSGTDMGYCYCFNKCGAPIVQLWPIHQLAKDAPPYSEYKHNE
jgi:hypothetical protein